MKYTQSEMMEFGKMAQKMLKAKNVKHKDTVPCVNLLTSCPLDRPGMMSFGVFFSAQLKWPLCHHSTLSSLALASDQIIKW